jgi:hypothetical protein
MCCEYHFLIFLKSYENLVTPIMEQSKVVFYLTQALSMRILCLQRPTPLKPVSGALLLGRLLASPKNIRLGWKSLSGTSTKACYKNL